MPQDVYDKLKRHQQALGFWEEAKIEGVETKHWHFPPKEFISAFRKCGWMKAEEMTQCMPRRLFHLHNSNFDVVNLSWAAAYKIIKEWSDSFNLATRRYGLAPSKLRVLHF